MSEHKHISEDILIAFQSDLLQPDETTKLLEHISSCNYCADQFAAFMSKDLITAPRDMKENILRATRRPEVQLVVKARQTSKRLQLFLYSLKVGTVTICALLLMLLTMNSSSLPIITNTTAFFTAEAGSDEGKEGLTSVIKNGVDKINNSILDFSNQIISKEVSNHDQKEK